MGDLNFREFKEAVQNRFNMMQNNSELFVTDTDKDALWETYLNSFPPGTNKMFRERTEYDCQCCKRFIRAGGNIVGIINKELISIWDIQVPGAYQVVADAMSKAVKSCKIKNVFLSEDQNLGTDYNRQILSGAETLKWEHFYLELPEKFVKRRGDTGPALSEYRSGKEVFYRGLDEITVNAAETVLELIEQNSLYRGDEMLNRVELFLENKAGFDKAENNTQKEYYCWSTSVKLGAAAKFRNTAVGTLLVDISEGKPLNDAVKMFESKVAPANYKRPTALISPRMIKNAQKKVEELGIEDSLKRRYATVEDITINNILFADRSTKQDMGIFDELIKESSRTAKNLDKVEAVDINTFIRDVLPKSHKLELLLENKHSGNLMSLIAPQHEDSKNILKWDNNFSWAYNGGVTDSIKEKVKKAGGNVEGVLRCSLSWFNFDDLDIHIVEPSGNKIFFGNAGRKHRSSGVLDVDMNAGGAASRQAVENIVWTNEAKMEEGEYLLLIHQYTQREDIDVGFDVEMEFKGTAYNFSYNKAVRGIVPVARFHFSRKRGLKMIESLPSEATPKEHWGIHTQKLHTVSMVMNSPNHWDGNETGNKHFFFILENCINDKQARGFFNEYLNEDLREHRKVFEVLGSKMKTEKSDNQLSGLGFSSTQRNHVFCKVSGSFTRMLKITF